MNERPISVTIISWFLIIVSLLSLVSNFFAMQNPEVIEIMKQNTMSIPLQWSFLFIGTFIAIISGIFMLKGANWARFLYVGWSAFTMLIGFLTSPAKLLIIPGLLFFGIIVFFLFRPKATLFFTQSSKE